MSTSTINAPWMHTEAVTRLFSALQNRLRFVGGCVRNTLLGQPVNDIDLATPLTPQQVIDHLTKHHIKSIPTGLPHGTVTAIIDSTPYEITTLRKDTDCDGRYAEVAFTDSWEEDAMRRDFTINALSCDIEGTIYDYVGGLRDIDPAVIRFVGDANTRCKEDYLRILRFFRFNAWYGSQIDTEGLSACCKQAEHIPSLSSERIWQEMRKFLSAPNPLSMLKKIHKTTVWLPLIGFDAELSVCKKLLAHEQYLYTPTNPLTRLASIILASKNRGTNGQYITKAWKLSNKESTVLHLLIDSTYKPSKRNIKELIRKHDHTLATQWLLLHAESDAAISQLKYITQNWIAPAFPLNGNDLLKQGFTTGLALGKQLNKAENYWIEHDYQPSKEDILSYIKSNINSSD
jgi:poly(A) polymerase